MLSQKMRLKACALSFCSLLAGAVEAQHAYAQKLHEAPQLNDVVALNLHPQGKLVAGRVFKAQDALMVWPVSEGQGVGKAVWDSIKSQPRAIFYGLSWHNNSLIVSKSDSSVPLLPADSVQGDLQRARLREKGGYTARIDFLRGRTSRLWPVAYNILQASSADAEDVAASYPVRSTSLNQSVTFYRVQGETARSLGQSKSQAPLIKEEFGLFEASGLLKYLQQPRGVFIEAADPHPPEQWTEPLQRRDVRFLSLQGSRSILPPQVSFLTTLADVQDGLWIVTYGPNLTQILFKLNNQGVQERRSLREFSWPGDTDRGPHGLKILAVSPNERFLLFSIFPAEGAPAEADGVWLLDWRLKKRRRLSLRLGATQAVWHAQTALIAFEPLRDQKDFVKYAALSFPEATLPADSPELDALVSQPPWEDAAPPAPAPDADEQAARAFLLDPALVRAALFTDRMPMQGVSGLKDAREWPLGAAPDSPPSVGTDEDGFIAVSPSTHQVLAFNAPPPRPPLPESIQAPEAARDAALAWARRHFSIPPPLKAAGAPAASNASANVSAEIKPELSASGRYVVNIYIAASAGRSGPLEWVVEVEAHSGKIAALRPFVPRQATGRDAIVLEPGALYGNGVPVPVASRLLYQDRLPRFSPDGTRLAWLSTQPRLGAPAWWTGRPFALWTAKTDGSEPKLLLDEVEALRAPAWSPDSRFLAIRLSPRAGADANAITVVDVRSGERQTVPAPPNQNISATLIGWRSGHELLLGWAHDSEGSCDLMLWSPDAPDRAPQLLAANWSDRMGLEWGARAALLSRDGKTLWALWSVPEEKAATRACAADLWAWNSRDLKQAPRRVASCLPFGSSLQEMPGALLLSGIEGALCVDIATGQHSPWPALSSILGTQSQDYGLDTAWLDAAIYPIPNTRPAFIAPRLLLLPANRHAFALHIITLDGQATPLLNAPPAL